MRLAAIALVLAIRLPPAFGAELNSFYFPIGDLNRAVSSTGGYVGETFTAGMVGELDSVSLALYKNQGSTNDAHLAIFPIVTGVARLSQGITLTIASDLIPVGPPPSGLQSMLNIDLSAFDFQVAPGVLYAIGINGVDVAWWGGCGKPIFIQCGFGQLDAYTRGEPVSVLSTTVDTAPQFDFVDFDLAHATYITAAVPEPETYVMLLAGLLLLGFESRHRRRPQRALSR